MAFLNILLSFGVPKEDKLAEKAAALGIKTNYEVKLAANPELAEQLKANVRANLAKKQEKKDAPSSPSPAPAAAEKPAEPAKDKVLRVPSSKLSL
jgi:hypothetical protein